MSRTSSLFLKNEVETLNAGRDFAETLVKENRLSSVVFLFGDLGAGKTTFVRGALQGFGYLGNVKSPTYTLLEPYYLDSMEIFHFDLYRINDPQELDFLGFDEIIDGSGLKFIEWADKAITWLPSPSFNLYFKYEESSKTNSSPGRSLQIEGFFDLE